MKRNPRNRVRRGARGSGLATLDTGALLREIERRRGVLNDLVQQRDDMREQLGRIESDIAELETLAPAASMRGSAATRSGKRHVHLNGAAQGVSGGRGGKGRGRGGNKQSLAALLHGLLQGRTMSVPEMADAARSAGHKTKSKNFRTIVSLALINNRNMFKRVGRGQYTAK